MAWQLMNEAEVKPSQNSGACSATAESLLEAFATDVSGLIKSIDPNHLVSLGTMGGGQCGAQGDEYRQLHAIPTIDLCEFHDYDSTAAIPGDQFNGMQVRLDQCAGLNKPLFVGEMGILPSDVGGLQARADAFRQKFRAQLAAGSVGEMTWDWDEDSLGQGSYSIGRSDPVLRVLAGAFNPGIQAISAGGNHSCAIDGSGGLWCWGDNQTGDLGDGTNDLRNRPVAVTGLSSGVVSAGEGDDYTCAAVASGVVKCWGGGSSGQLGTGQVVAVAFTPQDVTGLGPARTVVASFSHSCALLRTGDAACWGESGSGQLGGGYPIGGGVPSPIPVQLGTTAQDVEAGGGGCAVTTAGGAKCWGPPYFVGDGNSDNTSPRAVPVDVVGLSSGVIAIAPGGGHTCALTLAGVQCWGADNSGQLGNGQASPFPTYSPVPVIGLPDGIHAIASGRRHTCVINSKGGVLCWGDNNAGQLGNGTTNPQSTPAPVQGLASGVIALAAGVNHTCALLDTGVVKCWGDNSAGQLGRGPGANSLVPVKVDFVDHIEADDPTGANQYVPGGATALPVGATVDGTSMVIKSIVTAPSGGPSQLKLEAEVKPVEVPFNGLDTVKGPLVATGNVAQVTVANLARPAAYHWRVRALDAQGVTSQWFSYGGNPESSADFTTEAPIVFSSNRDVGSTFSEIYSMSANGKDVARLTATGTASNTEPVLSPDGTKIAFRTNRDGNFEIYVMDANGGNLVRLTDDPHADQQPAWSPDGSRIAFVSNRTGAYDIWAMNADGSSPSQLTTTAPSSDTFPSWSPDGSKICFVSVRDGDFEIFTMNANGTGQTQLTKNKVIDSYPAWSPDGTKILFTSNRLTPAQQELFVMNADGTNPVRLLAKAKDDVDPAWSRSGDRIVFQGADTAAGQTDWEIYRVASSGGTPTKITNNTASDVAPGW